MNQTYKYDVVLSFAGENRAIVERVRDELRERGIRVFYDFDEQHELLGKDLAEHFSELYQNAGQYCVIFVSQSYLDKVWCKWERRAALARALSSKNEYMIPYVLEEVFIPGIPETIGRAHMDVTPPWAFANLLARKVKGSIGNPKDSETTPLESQLSKSLTYGRFVWEIDNPRYQRISTGFSDLDEVVGTYLRSKAVYGIAGRPSIGKTAYSLNMAIRLSQRGISIVYLTADQSVRVIVQRLLALAAKVDLSRLGSGRLDSREMSRIAVAQEKLSTLPLRIVDAGESASLDVTLCELWAAISTSKSRAFFVDSLPSINATNCFGEYGARGSLRTLTALKWLAQETDTTGLVCLQLNRSLETRSDKTPVITDLRGGKVFANALESVFLLHRAEVYDPGRDKGTLDVFYTKPNRNSRRGPASLRFDIATGLVESYWDWQPGFDFRDDSDDTAAENE